MPEGNAWYRRLAPKAADEAEFIVREFGERGIDIDGVATEDGGVAFMYARDQLLAHESYLGQIQEVLRRRAEAVVVRRVIRDIVLLNVVFSDEARSEEGPEGEHEERPEGERTMLLRALAEIDAALGPGIATPNQVMTVAGELAPCPATEPQEVYGDGDVEPYPPACQGTGGARVRIYIADTGVLPDGAAAHFWLDGVDGDIDPRVDPDGTIHRYAGHGTFVAGVVKCLAPGAEVRVENVFDTAGSALEADFVPKLNAGFGWGAEIFHLTIASPTRCNLPLLAFEAWLELLRQYKGVVCVVAAGNNGNRLPCWPAAFSGVLSVGALSADWRRRAYFSNYGGWVDVYAPGQNLINAYATGTYTCGVTPFKGQTRHFEGMAQWSGTSFSTPIVTGLIAARMTRRGESAQHAVEALLAEAREDTIPGVGPVLLPGCDGEDHERGRDCERCGDDCHRGLRRRCGGCDGCRGGCDRRGCGCGRRG